MRYLRCLYEGNEIFCAEKENKLYPVIGDIYGEYQISDTDIDQGRMKILPPSVPTKIVAVGQNYMEHIKELGNEIPSNPTLFIKPTSAVIAHGENIIKAKSVGRIDYEAELCFIIKKTAKNVKRENAYEYISGYTCFNDVTARDVQKLDKQWTRAKGYDTFAPYGPVVSDEINPNDVLVKSILNGKLRQNARTSQFIWKIDELMEFITEAMTLYPGDVVTTGTPCGIGEMQNGDTIEIEIEGIGTLQNKVLYF